MSELNDLWQVQEITTKFWHKEQDAIAIAKRMSKSKGIYITIVPLRTFYSILYALSNRYDPDILETNGEK